MTGCICDRLCVARVAAGNTGLYRNVRVSVAVEPNSALCAAVAGLRCGSASALSRRAFAAVETPPTVGAGVLGHRERGGTTWRQHHRKADGLVPAAAHQPGHHHLDRHRLSPLRKIGTNNRCRVNSLRRDHEGCARALMSMRAQRNWSARIRLYGSTFPSLRGRVGFDSLMACSEHGCGERVGSVEGSVVGDDPLDSGDAVSGKPDPGACLVAKRDVP
jgi:hypothetical protein